MSSGLYSKRYLQGQLAVALAGRVVEELVYGEELITTGASGDLQQVGNIARRMVTQWGYNEKLGLSAWEMEGGSGGFGPQALAGDRGNDRRGDHLVAQAYEHCNATLAANRDIWEELTDMLIEKETVDYVEMEALIKKYYPDGLGDEKIPMPAAAKLM